jgi:hypothetical protein
VLAPAAAIFLVVLSVNLIVQRPVSPDYSTASRRTFS